MFTQCPECGTIFRVSAAVLRTARGQVRCGVCDATFDALEYLTEDVEVDPVTGAAIATDAAGPGVANPLAGGAAPAHVAPSAGLEDDAEPIEVSVELGRVDPSRLPPPEFPPFDEVTAGPAATAEPSPFQRCAGPHTPSADEDRALAEIAASIARNAKPLSARAGVAETTARDDRADTAASRAAGADEVRPDDVHLDDVPLDDVPLDDVPLDDVRLDDAPLDDVPDAALEFDAASADWNSVFVEDRSAPTIPPLDPVLARARAAALAAGPDAPVPAGDTAHGRDDEDLEIELEALGDLDEDDDGESDEEPSRPRRAAPAGPQLLDAEALERAPPRGEDPLSRTDQFLPLRLSAEEEAALGLADTAPAGPEPRSPALAAAAAVTAPDLPPPPAGVRPEDFDALVAAAAARAAAAVAAVVAAPPAAASAAASATAGLPAGATAPTASRAPAVPTTAAASSTLPDAERAAQPLDDLQGVADELSWSDARRDLEPGGTRRTDDDLVPEFVQFDPSRFQSVAPPRGGRAWWANALLGLAALALAAVLAAQAVHYWRDDLARHAVVGPPLREFYARIGLPLEPNWSLSAYELKQWGAGADSEPGTLRVRASVVNRAGRAQPYPLIRVTLEDRFGGKVARREFTPAEYLPTRDAPARLLASNGRVDADLVLADPGSEAVGFELDVCLPRRGALVCAEEVKLAQAP